MKYMQIGPKFAGQKFFDVLGRHDDPITLDENGGAQFHVHAGYVSVWLPENAYRFIRTTF
jgi:alpha-amylase